MKKIIVLLIFIVNSFALFSNDNLYLVWMKDKTNDRLYSPIVKALKQKLSDDYDVKMIPLTNYQALLSVIDNNKYYIDKDKLRTGLLADHKVFNEDGYYVVFRITQKGKTFYINGVKYKKDGIKGDIQKITLTKKITKNISNTIYNMLLFFVKSSIMDYTAADRKSVAPLVVEDNNKLKVISFTKQKVMLFNKPISSDDLDLAKSLNLVSYSNDAQFAKDYCSFLNMYLPNKIFVNPEDEYYFEEYYQQIDFKDGYKIYKYTIPTYITDKDFRCMGNDYTLVKEPLSDYELNNLGIMWKIHSSNLNKVGAVQSLNENNVKVVLVDDNGNLSVYKNNHLISSKTLSVSYKDIESVQMKSGKYIITAFNKKIIFNRYIGTTKSKSISNHYYYYNYYFKYSSDAKININQEFILFGRVIDLTFKATTFAKNNREYIVGGENGHLVLVKNKKVSKTYIGLKGNIVKVLFLDSSYFIAITNKGELAVYNISKEKPIKILPQIGYAYSDISMDKNGKYIIAVNLNHTAYIFLKKVLLKGE